jgi:phosphatidate phosphatase APP1
MYRRFETDELPGEKITLLLQDKIYDAITDHEGYFVFDIEPSQPIISDALYFELPLAAKYDGQQAAAIAEIMIPPADAEYGVISDIDDTIIQTGATSITGMLKTVLLTNAATRLPFEGATDFYNALQKGRNGIANNPFFYVSSSPWNLYDLITDFMDMQGLPQGPLLLRDFGIRSKTFVQHDYLGHKFKEIKQVLDTYPHLNFVLIGDSGEEDPVIYHEVVNHFPGRILAVYIRDVDKEAKRIVAQAMSEKIKALGVEMLLTDSSIKAMRHAVTNGLIK